MTTIFIVYLIGLLVALLVIGILDGTDGTTKFFETYDDVPSGLKFSLLIMWPVVLTALLVGLVFWAPYALGNKLGRSW